MGYRSVLYRRQLEARKSGGEPVPIEEGIAKVKDMKEEEVTEALVLENERTKQLKDLLEADLHG